MKRIGLFCALFLLGLVAGAQKVYFIYIQSDNSAPFYVRLGEKVTSSTASGYLILSNLRDSSYLLQAGFPGSNAVNRFQVALNGTDKGFVLKEVGGAWNLFDLQELTLLKALAAVGPTDAENQQMLAQADPFTRLLVQASDDYTLLTSGPSVAVNAVESLPPAPIRAVPEPKEKPQLAHATPAKADTVPSQSAVVEPASPVTAVVMPAATKQTGSDTSIAAPTAPAETPFQHSQVSRRSESSTTEGFGLVFIDNLGGSSDTIRLLIPNPKAPLVAKPGADTFQAPKNGPVAGPPVADTALATLAVTNRTTVKDTALVATRAAAAAVPAPTATVAVQLDTVMRPKVALRERPWTIGEAACGSVAEPKDFSKLRKNMSAASDEPEMVSMARKEFSKRCYSVEQVKLLGGLFLTDLGRYNFFAAAWGHLSDQPKFPELETLLKDAYLANRLYELTRNPAQ